MIYYFLFNELLKMFEKALNLPFCYLSVKGEGDFKWPLSILLYKTADSSSTGIGIHTNVGNSEGSQSLLHLWKKRLIAPF